MAERILEADGIELCTEAFGDPADPAVLLLMGVGASMIWWEDEFCEMLAAGGRFVVRYDHRDTGRSTTYPRGRPGYTGDDLVDDAARVLDGYGIAAADVAGVSAGGGLAQELALDQPGRVASLTLISTTAATPGDRDLPGPTDEFMSFVSTARVDWEDDDSIVDYMVGYSRMLSGTQRRFDDDAFRALVRRDFERARDYAALSNHDAIPDGSRAYGALAAITQPTVVIHGTADPMFPIEHGETLTAEIPEARLIRLEGAGHGLYRADWEAVAAAILEQAGR